MATIRNSNNAGMGLFAPAQNGGRVKAFGQGKSSVDKLRQAGGTIPAGVDPQTYAKARLISRAQPKAPPMNAERRAANVAAGRVGNGGSYQNRQLAAMQDAVRASRGNVAPAMGQPAPFSAQPPGLQGPAQTPTEMQRLLEELRKRQLGHQELNVGSSPQASPTQYSSWLTNFMERQRMSRPY